MGCLLGGGGLSGGGCCIKIVGKSMGCVYRVITSYPAYFSQQQKEKLQCFKVEKILKGSLDSIPSPSTSIKIQIMGGKVCLGVKAKHCWALSRNF